MSKLKKAFKNSTKKIAVFAMVMLALQSMMMAGIAPGKTYAATPAKDVPVLSPANHVVISEVQVGQTGMADNEFVELYNPTATDINLQAENLALHIKNSTGSDSNKPLTFASSIIKSNGFFLIAPNNSYATAIGADATYADSGNMLVANGSVSVSYTDGNDMVGWGTQPAGGYEGTAYAPTIPADQSIERKANAASTSATMAVGGTDEMKGNAYDTDNNANDFVARAIPYPQNSASPIEDIIAPTVTVNSSVTNVNTPVVTGTVTDNGTVKSVTIQVNGKTYNAVVVGTNWTAAVTDSLADSKYTVEAAAVDANYNTGMSSGNLTIDTVKPTVALDNPSVRTNNTTPTITGTASDASGVASVVVTLDGNNYPAILDASTGKWTFVVPAPLTELDHPITVTATDMAGNIGTATGVINIDTSNLMEVTNFTATTTSSNVTLTWTNPDMTKAGNDDFAKVNIYRSTDGGAEALIATKTKSEDTNFVDTDVKSGTTYTYTIKTVDTSGNESAGISQKVTVLSPVVAAPSVTQAVAMTPVTNETYGGDAGSSQGEVKAATIKPDDQKPADNNQKTETKDKKSIPLWGIIFLLVLAGVGGYLFYVQNPQAANGAAKSKTRKKK